MKNCYIILISVILFSCNNPENKQQEDTNSTENIDPNNAETIDIDSAISRIDRKDAASKNSVMNISDIDEQNNAGNINIEPFNIIPDEFNGAGCFFSTQKNSKPIFLEDVMGNALMLLDGNTVQLKWMDKTNNYIGNEFEVFIDIKKSITTGQESSEEEGFMIVKHKKGGKIRIKIFGECGA